MSFMSGISSMSGWLNRGARAVTASTFAGAAAHVAPTVARYGVTRLLVGRTAGALATTAATAASLPLTGVVAPLAIASAWRLGERAYDCGAEKAGQLGRNEYARYTQNQLNKDPVSAVGARSWIRTREEDDGWQNVSLHERPAPRVVGRGRDAWMLV